MAAKTYVKEKTRTLNAKYFEVRQHIQVNYRNIQRSIGSKFHRENTELDRIRGSLNHLIQKSAAPYLNENQLDIHSLSTKSESHTTSKDNIDWTRGRFAGKVVKIIVLNGKIVEKTFLTPKGNLIVVNRKELGLFVRLFR
tara:strand:- start:2778 stop:3197 length:420 start_codon:yes stop_codon:yes gene_type:complete